ncbi:MAG: tetratricopeptide repeat protein [Dactylosporangium sp.]|nr:tetratricopeptide repeat protein [Dactylosporangium sp.]NNJ60214.1 tetratricopeptide repeat protein [Dactylosporangium sp.]
MSDDASFGYLVRRLRRLADLTQRDLAHRIGYSVVTVRKIEADERRPSRDLAERLAQCLLTLPDERQSFLALARTPPTVPTNLATPLTRLIGRAEETTAVRHLLTDREIRLVTLVGPPGIGKTRLSVQIATDLTASFPHGVFAVAFGPISDPALVIPTIAKALGVKESAAQRLLDCLIDYLDSRKLLLVLDNVEHMLTAAPEIARLLTACPTLKVLATSRQPLHIRGEHLCSVPPLALPAPGRVVTAHTATGYPAIELFVERAQAADRTFQVTEANAADIAAVCARLEGIPLAIELVAARVKLLAPQALLGRLDSRLALLTGGPRDLPERQQTLRGTIDWSHRLLDDGEQALFARLAVFIGGCLPEAAETVANADGDLPMPVLDGLEALADKNLLRQEQRVDGERYSVFFETIREFALERLIERDEATAVRQRYAAYYLRLAETASQHLTGREQEAWLDRLEAEHNNVRAVTDHHIQHHDCGQALRMVAALWRFWHVRAHQTEGWRWIKLALALEGPHEVRHRAQALNGAGWIAQDQSDPAQALAAFTESLRLCRVIDDKRGIAEALHGVGGQLQASGNDSQAIALFSESLGLYRELDDQEGIAWSLDHLGYAALYLDDPDRAMALFEESRGLFQRLEHTWGNAISLHHQGLTMMARGKHDLALSRLNEGLSRFEELGNSWGVAQSLYHLGRLAVRVGDHVTAAARYRGSLTLSQTEEDRTAMIRSLAGLGSVAVLQGRLSLAARLFGAVEAFAESQVLRLTPLESAVHERDVSAVQSRRSDPAVVSAWSAGRSMSLTQLVDYAMGSV